MVMADKTCGLISVQMILMALFHRERTGEGQSIEIPMFENMAAFVLTEHMYMKRFDPPRGPTGDPRLLDPQAKPYHTLDSLMEDPHLKEVDFFETIEHPTEGRIVNMALPNKLSKGAQRDFSPAPKIGQHSVEILGEVGYSETEIWEMVSRSGHARRPPRALVSGPR